MKNYFIISFVIVLFCSCGRRQEMNIFYDPLEDPEFSKDALWAKAKIRQEEADLIGNEVDALYAKSYYYRNLSDSFRFLNYYRRNTGCMSKIKHLTPSMKRNERISKQYELIADSIEKAAFDKCF